MTAGRPWYKRYGGDFIAGTMELSLEEKGAYSIVLDLLYDRAHPIPDDPQYIARVCGCSTRRWKIIRDRLLVADKLYITDDGEHLSNRRFDRESPPSQKTGEKRRKNGAKGGEKSAEKRPKRNENNDIAGEGLEAGQSPESRVHIERESYSSSHSADDAREAAAAAAPDEAVVPSPPVRSDIAAVVPPPRPEIVAAVALLTAARAGLTEGGCPYANLPDDLDIAHARQWLALGADADTARIVAARIGARRAAAGEGPPARLRYLTRAIVESLAAPVTPTPAGGPSHAARPARHDRHTARTAECLDAIYGCGKARILAAGGGSAGGS
ncbi:YdaU family protein [uncultured Rhodospira sp.]|uniref:YdaU family protein n=1 Tax=uncultured Rhodospira sp. TaxID=1936189 RepID=UPI00260C4400|nr:YdaU family protein [uncultured Rhodospira sp.]